MKEKILNILTTSGKDNIISGVYISSLLGISRVAVWKHLKKLKQEGYDIKSSSRGYQLRNSNDLLFPFCFKNQGSTIHYFPRIPSTMDIAKKMARNNKTPHLTVVIAEEQTKGRGRLKRIWNSSKGGLWFSIILRPNLPPPFSFKVNFAASISLVRTLNKLFKINATVKWPNDILLNEKKLAGLLSEMETKGDMISFVNIGIGLNVNNFPEKHEPNAVSIRTFIGKKVLRKKILSCFLNDFEKQLKGIYHKNIIKIWKKYTSTIGRKVKIETYGEISEGVATDVDDTGSLILKQKNGITKKIIYGDCFYKKI
ncbi:MAG: biotin--[acetyl-CoA-carboxylase] ligase [Desulfobacteraceae bacterium 4572_130]|nr:MAG: biotin--[acetyl-CoA-carboxylase] ligase [Desulfobacteraceae bacterium 4572_130]